MLLWRISENLQCRLVLGQQGRALHLGLFIQRQPQRVDPRKLRKHVPASVRLDLLRPLYLVR
jgi:hypothetical protein